MSEDRGRQSTEDRGRLVGHAAQVAQAFSPQGLLTRSPLRLVFSGLPHESKYIALGKWEPQSEE